MSVRTARPHTTHILDGSWELAWLGDADLTARALQSGTTLRGASFTDRIGVPGCFDTLPELAGARGTAAYRTVFRTGEEPVGLLHFDGVSIWAAVYVDGVLLHVHRKPYSPFTVEVPPAATDATGPGATHGPDGSPVAPAPVERELVVLVDNRFDGERSPLQENYFDFYAYGGILRPVRYIPLPAVHITDVRVRTTALEPPTITVEVDANTDTNVELRYIVDGTELSRSDSVDGTATSHPHEVALPDATPWTPEEPSLHSLTVIMHAGSSVDSYRVSFGIRTVSTRDGEILLNGAPIRLFGWNRHEAHPHAGPALTDQQMVQDIQLMKRAGANFVRGSHYPQDERFLDLCDAMGLLVWEESLGWQQNESHFTNPEYHTLIAEQQGEMVRAHRNHPSIIMWGFQNELHSELDSARPLVESLAAITREADPSRPVTFASNRFPEDRCLDIVDIVSINLYPGWYAQDPDTYRPLDEIAARIRAVEEELDHQGLARKPLVLSEIGAGAIYGWRDEHAGHWSEQYQADYLLEVCSQFLERGSISGLALWQFADARTYGSARALMRPGTFNNKGIVDAYRRPKQAYDLVRQLMTNP